MFTVVLLVVYFAVMIGIGLFCRKNATDVNGFVLGGRSVCLLSALLSGAFYFCGRAFYGRYCRDFSYFGAEREQKDGNPLSAVSFVFLSDLFG